MKKYKKLALLLILCSVVSIFTGCDADFKISIRKLDSYVSTKIEGQPITGGIDAAFEDGQEIINTSLDDISDIFSDLTISTGTASNTVSGVANAMKTNMNSIFSSPLSDGKNLTPLGKDISQALYIDNAVISGTSKNNYNDGLFAYVLRGITSNVKKSLKDGKAYTITNLNFDGNKASSRETSEVNRALTLLGYSIEDVNVGIIMMDTQKKVDSINSGCNSITDVATKFVNDNPCMTANSTGCKCGKSCFNKTEILTGAWSLDADTVADKNLMMYYLTSKTDNLVGYLDIHGNKEYPVIKGKGEISIYPMLLRSNTDDRGFNETFYGDEKKKYNNNVTFETYMLNLGCKGFNGGGYGAGDKFRYTRGYALAQATYLWDFCDMNEEDIYNSTVCWEPIKDNSGHITKFAGIIGGIKQISGAGAGSDYWALIRIVIDVKHLSGTSSPYFDITKDLAKAYSLDSAQQNCYSLYHGISGAASIKDFVKILDDKAADATIVTVKKDFKGLDAYDEASDVYRTVANSRNSIQLGDDSPFEVVKKNGKDYRVNILDTLTNSEFDPETDSSKIIKTDLYIGAFKLGTLCLETINPAIAASSNVATLSSQGLTSTGRTMQRFKMYTSAVINGVSKERLYLLFGLSDIHIVNKFTAIKTDDSTEYTYLPEFRRSGMVYNIFNNGIYVKSGDNKVVEFTTDASDVNLYTANDILINKRTWSKDDIQDYTTDSRDFISSETTQLSDMRLTLGKLQSPFVLNTYLEGLFCPNWVNDEPFVCLGRKLSFTADAVFTDTIIGEDTPIFNIFTPDMTDADMSSIQSHGINELLSSSIQRKERYTSYDTLGNPTSETTMMVDAIIKLKYSKEAEKIRGYSSYDSIDTISTLQEDMIFFGEFKTAKNIQYKYTGDVYGRFANAQEGTEKALGIATPRLYVWCTSTSVNNSLPNYLKSPQFEMWRTWLNNNGYETYLGAANQAIEGLVEDLVHRIESVYDLNFGTDLAGKDIIIDTSGLDQLDDWLDRKTEEKKNAIIDVILRIIAIILLIYGVAILVCYIIDVAVSGEGTGILKKITFNRMMTVTGLTKEERKAMSERNEKGTYTTRAVAITDLIPIILIMWGIATILIIGSAYNIVDTLISIGEKITQIIRQAISKE